MIALPAWAQREHDDRDLPAFVPGTMWVKLDMERAAAHDATMRVVRVLAGLGERDETKTFWLVPGLHLVRVPVGHELALVEMTQWLEGVEWTSVEGFGSVTQAGACVQPDRQCQDEHCADQYWIENVNLDDAWARIEGMTLPDVVIAVIDTGVNYNHPELINNMWTNPDEIPTNGVDDDSNGIVDDVYGAAFVSRPFLPDPCASGLTTCAWEGAICGSCQPADGDPQDATQDVSQVGTQQCVDYSASGGGLHGTACAAIIAAAANNDKVRGIACNIKIMAIRVFPRCYNLSYPFTESSYVEAIQYAASEGASVISNSLQLGTGPGLALENAIKNLAFSDVVFVTSAGNENADVDDPGHPNAGNVYPPQRIVRDHVIHVGASDDLDARAGFSNWGVQTVDIFAPGVDIRVFDDTALDPYTGYISGTSFSTPMVAGAVALYRSLNPSVSADDVVLRVKATARPVSALSGLCESGGVLDVDALITP